jgi:hypothetical protein
MKWTPDVDDTLLNFAQQHAPWRFAKVKGQAQAWTQVAAAVNQHLGVNGLTYRNSKARVMKLVEEFEERDTKERQATGAAQAYTIRDEIFLEIIADIQVPLLVVCNIPWTTSDYHQLIEIFAHEGHKPTSC